MMENTKGVMLKYSRDFVVKKFGEAALVKVHAAMKPEDREFLARGVPLSSWVPDPLFLRLLGTIDQTAGRGDNSLLFDLGQYIAAESIPKFYAIFIKFGSVAVTFKSAPSHWRQVHSGGKLEVISYDDHHSNTHLTDFYPPKFGSRAFCFTLGGYCKGVLDFAGVKNSKVVETKCTQLGDSCCEFLGSWT